MEEAGHPSARFRGTVLLLAGLEVGLILWLCVRAGALEADWTEWEAWEALWLPGLFLLPSGAALVLAAAGRGLGCALVLVLLFALMAFAALQIARTATVAG